MYSTNVSKKSKSYKIFNEEATLHKLKHYLPTQNPLKDFVHHNSLHAFQSYPFHEAVRKANAIFGYKGYLQLSEYRSLYQKGKISEEAIEYAIKLNYGEKEIDKWKNKMLHENYDEDTVQRIGKLRKQWKSLMYINLDKQVFPFLFRLISGYLDQGISINVFPITDKGFLTAIREIEKNNIKKLFFTDEARSLLYNPHLSIEMLLELIVGREEYFEYYLFDQQFSHPGWSGMVAVVEENPNVLLDKRKISLREFIIVELLLELDALCRKYDNFWSPLGYKAKLDNPNIFDDVPREELFDIYKLWLESFEWTYYFNVIGGINHIIHHKDTPKNQDPPVFQAFFCIDDRSVSIRQYLELLEERCETYGTPGHFNLLAYYKPDKGKFLRKICPAALEPKYIIKEKHTHKKIVKDSHFHSSTHSGIRGWFLTQTLGFLSGFNLFRIIFSPSYSAATSYAFEHMHKEAELKIELNTKKLKEGLKEGLSWEEMTDIVCNLLSTTGLIKNFARLVYLIGHGASSTNNPYYAAYGCGACSGRPGSVNARAVANMANYPEVRKLLAERDIFIPENTYFIGALHDTTRDEIVFYDIEKLPFEHQILHQENEKTFEEALIHNACERARRFENIRLNLPRKKIYAEVKKRSVTLFEIRPEYNHATNSLFIIGRRDLTKNLFLDRRSFLNSYDYRQDIDGKLLADILKAGVGVCAGINLEYYFSRVDNKRLGAGSKLPQNIVGLIGVANGVEGDLRTGLPYQMVEIHDPVRLLTIIEQSPDIILDVLNEHENVKEWYKNQWVNLISLDPIRKEFYWYDYKKDTFISLPYFNMPCIEKVSKENLSQRILSSRDNLPVMYIEK